MTVFKIDGKEWDVNILSISESFNVLHSDKTGRTISAGARMVLDPLGTFYGHRIVVLPKQGKEKEFDNLFDFVSLPRYDGVMVEALHGQETISYEAYISNGNREVKKVDAKTGKVTYNQMEINVIPMEAQVLPV